MQAAPHPELVHTLIALGLVSLGSIVGSLSFALGKWLKTAIPYLVSAAAGALLGTALCNLLPEALEHSTSSNKLGLLLTLGFLISFLLERLLGMLFREGPNDHEAILEVGSAAVIGHHLHQHQQPGGKTLVTNVLLSGAIHSLVDGIGIAAAFSSSHTAGVATTLAVLLHEIPHHIADVGVLIYSGVPKGRAILLNLLATSGCATGGVVVLLFGTSAGVLTSTLLPITAANFLYIAVGILMPELQRERNQARSILQMAALLATVLILISVSHYFPESKQPSLAALTR